MTPVAKSVETLESLRARYPRSLDHVYDQVAIVGGGISPGEVAANVFDFEDGLRLIVSRERMEHGDIVLHVSASFTSDSRIADEFRLLGMTTPRGQMLEMWTKSIPDRFRELSGDDAPITLVGWSGRIVPHFVRTLEVPWPT